MTQTQSPLSHRIIWKEIVKEGEVCCLARNWDNGILSFFITDEWDVQRSQGKDLVYAVIVPGEAPDQNEIQSRSSLRVEGRDTFSAGEVCCSAQNWNAGMFIFFTASDTDVENYSRKCYAYVAIVSDDPSK